MISKLAAIFGSKTKAQEIVSLLAGAKPVVRHGYYEYELPKVELFCKENQLYFVKSNFKVQFADEGSYSNKGIRFPLTDPRPGMFFIYISPDEHKAWQASYYELQGNDRELGRILGYPVCCVDFFCRRFSEQNPNLQLQPTNPFTNLTQRAQDLVLLSHFPCNSDCIESIKIGRRNLEVIQKLDTQRATEIEQGLRTVRVNDLTKGL